MMMRAKLIVLLTSLIAFSDVVDAQTLGLTGTPDTPQGYDSDRVKAIYVGQMPADGTLTFAHIYVDSNPALENDQHFTLGVYTGSATFPITYVDSEETIAQYTTPGWKSVALSGALVSGAHIWVAFAVPAGVDNNTLRVWGTAAGASYTIRQGDHVTVGYPAMPTPWANDDTFAQNAPGAYITYSGSGAGGLLLRRRRN